jgi:hypothetical protein
MVSTSNFHMSATSVAVKWRSIGMGPAGAATDTAVAGSVSREVVFVGIEKSSSG